MSERAHPYDLVFATPDLEGKAFLEIREESEARGVDTGDREQFLLLARMGELMRSLLPDDATGPAFPQFAAIVLHAYHYWLAGKQTFTLEENVLRSLLAHDFIGSWHMVTPAPAGYVQLPRNLLFARIEDSAHAEAIDGFFFRMDPQLEILLVLGLVPNRAGFSIIDVPAEVMPENAAHYGDVTAREDGADFENILPGGEGLFAVTNSLEALKLASRCFWHLAANG